MSNLKNILLNQKMDCKSIWFMRQAGRYLPEFRSIRLKHPNFINLCLNSDLSSQITLQPIKRYDLDSAIIFSDILIVPYAMGQEIDFVKNKGPKLSKFVLEKFLDNNKENFTKKLDPVYQAIAKTRKKLDKRKTLIAFIGAPWTLITYMLGVKNKPKENNMDDKNKIEKIIKNLIDYLCLHIKKQIEAGANVVQIFDSWAGLLKDLDLQKLCFLPNLSIVDFCKENKIPVICFPKGIGKKYKDFNRIVKPNGLSIDYNLNPEWAKKNLTNVVLQGGMDPKVLLESDKKIFNEAKKYLDIFKDVPYIFNLGHGIVPETNPDKLGKLIKFVREYK